MSAPHLAPALLVLVRMEVVGRDPRRRTSPHRQAPTSLQGEEVTHPTVAALEQQIAHAHRTMTAPQLINTLPQLQQQLAEARAREEGQ